MADDAEEAERLAKIAALEKELMELKQGAAAAAEPTEDTDMMNAFANAVADTKAAPESPPPSPPGPAFDPFPTPASIGVDGLRCCILFHAYDGVPKAETLLETFEDEAAEFAGCGCALVCVRSFSPSATPNGKLRKAEEYAERFPSFNFVDDLKELPEQRAALGLGDDWVRSLYNEPVVALLDPDGGMRLVISHTGLSARNVLGNTLRQLHVAVPPVGELSTVEAEANRQALYNENVQWAKILEEDESLRQPTRTWFDGFFDGPSRSAPLLAGVESAALPEAIDRFLEDGVLSEDEEEEPLMSKDGVKAPSWYARAKRNAERKQEAERLLWNGTAPSATPGPLPLGPQGARLAPMQSYTRKALQEANVAQRRLVSAFFQKYGGEEFKFLTGDQKFGTTPGGGDAAAAEELRAAERAGAGAAKSDGSAPRTGTTDSALLRAEMLALGLSRSATSTQSTRRLRLLQELEGAVRELEAEGFSDRKVLSNLKAQIKKSYATAPDEFIKEARKENLFNEYAPAMSLSEIAAEFAGLVERAAERSAENEPEWDTLDPKRKRGQREKGNKIQINPKRPAE